MKMVILESNDIESSEELAKELLGSKYSINKKNKGTVEFVGPVCETTCKFAKYKNY